MSPGNEFDRHAQEYTNTIDQSIEFSGRDHAFFTALKASEIAALLEKFVPETPPQVLDVGCGIGVIHTDLRAAAGTIGLVGVDVSQSSIDLACRRNPDSLFMHYDGRRLPFDDMSFDAAFTICVLHHVDPPERAAFMAEVGRVVRPGGLAIIVEHNPLNPVTRHVVNGCEMDRDAVLLRAVECSTLLKDAGFGEVATRYIAFLPFDAAWARRLERCLAWLPLGAQFISYGIRLSENADHGR